MTVPFHFEPAHRYDQALRLFEFTLDTGEVWQASAPGNTTDEARAAALQRVAAVRGLAQPPVVFTSQMLSVETDSEVCELRPRPAGD